jgi:hypothetical protein
MTITFALDSVLTTTLIAVALIWATATIVRIWSDYRF